MEYHSPSLGLPPRHCTAEPRFTALPCLAKASKNSRDGVEELLGGEVGDDEPGAKVSRVSAELDRPPHRSSGGAARCSADSLLALGELELLGLTEELLLVGVAGLGGRGGAVAKSGGHCVGVMDQNVRCGRRRRSRGGYFVVCFKGKSRTCRTTAYRHSRAA